MLAVAVEDTAERQGTADHFIQFFSHKVETICRDTENCLPVTISVSRTLPLGHEDRPLQTGTVPEKPGWLVTLYTPCPRKNCTPVYLAITLANNVGF